MDIYYNSQVVLGEKLEEVVFETNNEDPSDFTKITYQFKHFPILWGTIEGNFSCDFSTNYYNYKFKINTDSEIKLFVTKIKEQILKPILVDETSWQKSEIDHEKGLLTVIWQGKNIPNEILVNYEYEME